MFVFNRKLNGFWFSWDFQSGKNFTKNELENGGLVFQHVVVYGFLFKRELIPTAVVATVVTVSVIARKKGFEIINLC